MNCYLCGSRIDLEAEQPVLSLFGKKERACHGDCLDLEEQCPGYFGKRYQEWCEFNGAKG